MTAVVTAFDGRTELLDAFVRRIDHELMVLLCPEHDDARRLLHALRFEGFPVHLVERPVRLPDEVASREVAVTAAHYLRARWIVPLRLDEELSSSGGIDGRALDGDALRRTEPAADAPAAGDPRAVVRTTSLPGPAHKEHVALVLRPGLARTVLLPLHLPAYTSYVRVTLEGFGCALIDVDAVRVFRTGDRTPVELDPLDAASCVRVAGPGPLVPPPLLQALALDGDAELLVDLASVSEHGPCDALELRLVTTPVDPGYALSSAALDAFGAAYRDPWYGVAAAERALGIARA